MLSVTVPSTKRKRYRIEKEINTGNNKPGMDGLIDKTVIMEPATVWGRLIKFIT